MSEAPSSSPGEPIPLGPIPEQHQPGTDVVLYDPALHEPFVPEALVEAPVIDTGESTTVNSTPVDEKIPAFFGLKKAINNIGLKSAERQVDRFEKRAAKQAEKPERSEEVKKSIEKLNPYDRRLTWGERSEVRRRLRSQRKAEILRMRKLGESRNIWALEREEIGEDGKKKKIKEYVDDIGLKEYKSRVKEARPGFRNIINRRRAISAGKKFDKRHERVNEYISEANKEISTKAESINKRLANARSLVEERSARAEELNRLQPLVEQRKRERKERRTETRRNAAQKTKRAARRTVERGKRHLQETRSAYQAGKSGREASNGRAQTIVNRTARATGRKVTQTRRDFNEVHDQVALRRIERNL